MSYDQLDIWWVNLEPTIGQETQKKRPCVIVSCNRNNLESQMVSVAPLLPGHKSWPFAVNIKRSSDNNLDKDRYINLKQARAVDIARFDGKLGHIEPHYFLQVEAALKQVFGLS